jgi:hypothetical protein
MSAMPQKSNSKPKRPTTRLWYVCLVLEPAGPVVLVSASPIDGPCVESRRIRSITANAAGRRYLRNNVETALAGVHFQTDNPASENYRGLTGGMVKRFKGKGRNTPMRVIG